MYVALISKWDENVQTLLSLYVEKKKASIFTKVKSKVVSSMYN